MLQKKAALGKAKQLMEMNVECCFKFLESEQRPFLPDRFLGPWKQQ